MTNPNTKTEAKTEAKSSSTPNPFTAFNPFAPMHEMWTDAVERFQQFTNAQQNLASMWTEASAATQQMIKTQQQFATFWTDAAPWNSSRTANGVRAEKPLVRKP